MYYYVLPPSLKSKLTAILNMASDQKSVRRSASTADQNYVQSHWSNGKLDEGYSRMKGCIEEIFLCSFLCKEVLILLPGSDKSDQRLDFCACYLFYFNFEWVIQVLVKLWICLLLF